MSQFSKGSKAFGYCDRTGFRYPINELVEQYENGRPNGLRVGKDVLDEDHPQLRLSEVKASDPQRLQHPRPDTSQAESRGMWAWNPVGGGISELGTMTVGLDMSAEVGRVTVSAS